MRCTYPRTVGYQVDGKTLCWSPREYCREFATFQLPCGKCIECRLEYARSWAVRCVHEAQMHERNSFITLTYSDEFLPGDKLQYSDFQKFMKRLRRSCYGERIGFFVTGEYGEKNKRPHWHAILFNFRPGDLVNPRKNDRGDISYTSESLSKLWGFGRSELGDVTFESAGYCARYAAKKLVHGYDDDELKPISKKSSKNAIGKSWLEKYWLDIFSYGECQVKNSSGVIQSVPIPRYYEKWLSKNRPGDFQRYVTEVKLKKSKIAYEKELSVRDENRRVSWSRVNGPQISPLEVRRIMSKDKFKRLMKFLKF